MSAYVLALWPAECTAAITTHLSVYFVARALRVGAWRFRPTVIYHDRNSYTGPGGCSGVVIVVVGAGEERDSRCPPKPGGLICLWLRSRPWGRVGPVTGPVGHHVPSLFVRSGKVGVLVTTLSLLTYSTHPPPLVWSSSINHQTDWPMRPSAGPP